MAQINTIVGNLRNNKQKIIHYISKAKDIGVDILTFPELAVCGYPPEDLVYKKHFVRHNMEIIQQIVPYTKDITVVVGFVDMDDNNGNVYNAAGILCNNQFVGVYHKMVLPNYGVFDEKRHFDPGQKYMTIVLGSSIISVSICEDIWNNVEMCEPVYEYADIILNISASPYHAGKKKIREEILRKNAVNNNAFVCYNNLIGGQDELVFDGNSMIVDNTGNVIVYGKEFEEDLIVMDIPVRNDTQDKYQVLHTREDMDVIHVYATLDKKKPDVCYASAKRLDEIEEIYLALVLGTHDYVTKNGFNKVVIGLSGGIDSALTATIAVDALGNDNVICISMPSMYSSMETQQDAKILSENLQIELKIIPITDIFQAYMDVLAHEFKGLKQDITEENIQARIRGNILMAFSNKFGWLVLTTGNKSEMGVGYSTLYGDMAGGFAVLKDVPKTLVYKLAEYRNAKVDKEIIPESILRRAPSAELKPDQTDQDVLPPYEILDVILEEYVEKDRSSDDIISIGFDPDVVRKIVRMVDRNEYKRRQGPPGIRITPKAFGKDRRLPITNQYVDF
jgi:NAD+ synthase (glutamine-hydrolysing)